MEKENVKRIILNAVESTEETWRQYGIYWKDIDYLFIQRGYEQGGFNTSKFSKLLIKEKIFSINKIGQILNYFDYNKKYDREFAGSLTRSFYKDLKKGKADEEGIGFYKAVKSFKGSKGMSYYRLLWYMLVCCNYLKNNYDGSFSTFLLTKYSKFKNKKVDENKFMNILPSDWNEFKKTKPWDELYGISTNVFDFILGDLIDEKGRDFEFVKDNYKLDDSNIRFLKATGICREPEHDEVVRYLKSLDLPYTIRQINKGIYSYCSKTALNEVKEQVYQGNPKNHGFCHPNRCKECNVSDMCQKNFEN